MFEKALFLFALRQDRYMINAQKIILIIIIMIIIANEIALGFRIYMFDNFSLR